MAGRRAGRAMGAGFRACAGGSAAVEFALVAPVLLALLAGILAFGIFLGAANSLRQLAAEAARASVAGVTDAERASLAQQRVSLSLASGSFFRPGSVGVQVGPDAADPTLYTVTLSYDATALGLGSLAKLVPLPPETFRSTVSVRRGGM